MNEFRLRQANVSDAEGIAKIHVSTWQTTYSGLIPDSFLQSLNVEQKAKNWIRNLESSTPGNQTIVAEVIGKIVGFIGVGPSREIDDANHGEVYAIYVDARFQSQGVGTELMQQGLLFLKDERFERAILWVLDKNSRTREWYECLGWKCLEKSKIDKRADFEIVEIKYAIEL